MARRSKKLELTRPTESSEPSTFEVFWLDYPPSVNGLYTNVYLKGRVISPNYRRWKALFPPQGTRPSQPITSRFRLRYYLKRHADKRRRDLENYAKALTDSLVNHGFVADDSLTESLWMEWIDTDTDLKVKGVIECLETN